MRRSIRQDGEMTKSVRRAGVRFGTLVLVVVLAVTSMLALGIGPDRLLLLLQRFAAEQDPEAALAEQEAKTALRQRGFLVISDPQTKHVEYISFFGRKDLDDATLQKLAALHHLTSVNLHDTNIGDEQLHYLRPLSRLIYLDLSGTGISDNGLACLADSTDLITLHVHRTRISNDGLPHIARMRNLEILGLRQTSVTEEGLSRLRCLPKLDVLQYGEIATEGPDSRRPQNVEASDARSRQAQFGAAGGER